MDKEELIRNLKYAEKKHRNDTVNIFDTDISKMCSDVLRVLENCIEIPDGATRRDAFKAVFGYEPATDAVVCNKEDWCGASEPCNYCTSNPDNIGREEDWWDAPYRVKSEVEE